MAVVARCAKVFGRERRVVVELRKIRVLCVSERLGPVNKMAQPREPVALVAIGRVDDAPLVGKPRPLPEGSAGGFGFEMLDELGR
jgi:hypothetical protein